ncbi:hypothetical protein AGMMS50225_05500 [Betaproteobacteria bacterium]|nr:hypothetical protein AGMMS50225_05500 [Betaproteobacteria bacterium]
MRSGGELPEQGAMPAMQAIKIADGQCAGSIGPDGDATEKLHERLKKAAIILPRMAGPKWHSCVCPVEGSAWQACFVLDGFRRQRFWLQDSARWH